MPQRNMYPVCARCFVRNESVVAYSYASVRHVTDIEKAIANGTAIKREKVSADILRRARSGILESDFTPIGVRHLYREFMYPAPRYAFRRGVSVSNPDSPIATGLASEGIAVGQHPISPKQGQKAA